MELVVSCIWRREKTQRRRVALSNRKYCTTKKDIMTAAQQLRQEGIQERNWTTAKRMLHSNEPKEKVHQFTGLSWVEIEQLLQEENKHL